MGYQNSYYHDIFWMEDDGRPVEWIPKSLDQMLNAVAAVMWASHMLVQLLAAVDYQLRVSVQSQMIRLP